MQLHPSALGTLLLLAAPQDSVQPSTEGLNTKLEALRAEYGLPGLGAALVTRDGLVDVWVAGTRRAGGAERVEDDDLWHLGSCTKSMTATLIALLVARGDLAWDTMLGDLLPELAPEMHVDYTDLTLVELMSHRAGITNNLNSEALRTIIEGGASLPEQRDAITRAVLALPPVHAPRGAILYSNFGFLVAGHVAEVATKKPWEELIQELLFGPLGMRSAGFGAPGTTAVVDQPRGHTDQNLPVEPGPTADNPAVLGPAGTVHASLRDWAKYVALHLRGAKEDVKVGELTLTRETFARLHGPFGIAPMRYALGWGVEERPWAGGDGKALWHNGSNTLWYCVAWLGLENGVAALVTTNISTGEARMAVDAAAKLVLDEHARRLATASEKPSK